MLSLFKRHPEWPSNLSKEDLEEARTSELNTLEDWKLIDAELDKRGMQ